MTTKRIARDRADARLDRLARDGRSWADEVATRRARAMSAAETRRRRAAGIPDPPKAVKRSAFPAHLWRAPDGRIAMQTSYRPAMVARIRDACPGAWWCVSLGAWLVDARHASAALGLIREFYEHVTIDTSVAALLGWLVFPPQGPNGEERAA